MIMSIESLCLNKSQNTAQGASPFSVFCRKFSCMSYIAKDVANSLLKP